MRKAHTKTNSPKTARVTGQKRVKISKRTRQLYEKRDKGLDNDPDAPTLPLEMWENAVVGKYYRPLKQQVSVRIDKDVLNWLKAEGEGHLTRINDILRDRMNGETRARAAKSSEVKSRRRAMESHS